MFVNSAAHLLASRAEVTVVTSSAQEEEYWRLRAAHDPRLPDVAFAFVPEPHGLETAGFFSHMHCYSARVFETLRALYPEGGPDLVEFGDYLGEGFVTVQAADAEDPFLAATLVAVRVHTSAEMCAVLDGEIRHHFATEATHTMERFVLEHADRLIEQGGDILGTYERFYRGRLAPEVRIRYPFRGATGSPGADAGCAVGEPLRLLYAGRLERRKGVHSPRARGDRAAGGRLVADLRRGRHAHRSARDLHARCRRPRRGGGTRAWCSRSPSPASARPDWWPSTTSSSCPPCGSAGPTRRSRRCT